MNVDLHQLPFGTKNHPSMLYQLYHIYDNHDILIKNNTSIIELPFDYSTCANIDTFYLYKDFFNENSIKWLPNKMNHLFIYSEMSWLIEKYYRADLSTIPYRNITVFTNAFKK